MSKQGNSQLKEQSSKKNDQSQSNIQKAKMDQPKSQQVQQSELLKVQKEKQDNNANQKQESLALNYDSEKSMQQTSTNQIEKVEQRQEQSVQSKGNGKKAAKVQITKKELKQYLKFATENQSIKKQYNKVAKQLMALKEQFDVNEQALLKVNQENLKQKERAQKMEKEIDSLNAKLKGEKQKSQKQAGLQQTIKELQKIIDVSTNNQQAYQRQMEKYKEINRIEAEMNSNLKVEVEELRHVSSEYFLLKQQVSRLSNELRSLKDAKAQYPKMVEKYQQQQQANLKLKETISQLENNLSSQRLVNEKMEKKMDALMEENRNSQKKYFTLVNQKEELQGQLDTLRLEYQDQQSEIEVQRKRYASEIKDLKLALHHEHEKLKLLETQLAQSKKRQKKSTNIETLKFSQLSKEDLFNLVEELQMKNASIKINLDCLAEEIIEKDKKIEEQKMSIMQMSRQLMRDLPTLQESQGMEYVEKDTIQMSKDSKQDWGEIVQKVMLENLRLKNSVTALGQEYNMRLRRQDEDK